MMPLPLEIESALPGAGLLRTGKFAVTPLDCGVPCDVWRVGEDGCQVAAIRPLAQNLS